MANISQAQILLDREMLELLFDYLTDLRGEWYWKKDSSDEHNKEMEDLQKTIDDVKNKLYQFT